MGFAGNFFSKRETGKISLGTIIIVYVLLDLTLAWVV